jgi:MtrB/PioB family decaheme-associated outer membrane protein
MEHHRIGGDAMQRSESRRLMHRWTRGTVLPLLLAVALLPCTWARAQDDDDEPDEQLYTELTKFGSEVELGFLWNSDDSFQFGNYTGLYRDGFYFLGNVDTMWRGLLGDDDASYLRLRGLSLGLDSRYADVEFGRQGRYGLFVEYDELPVYQSETAETFFLGPGDKRQTLPAGWKGITNDLETQLGVDAVPQIEASLRQVDVDWNRRRIGGGFSFVLPANLTLDGRYDWERKKGTKLMGATMGLTGGNPRAQINWEPLEYVTQNFETNLRYASESLQLSLGYYGSAFNDKNDFMRWESPYLAAGGSGLPFGGWDQEAAGWQGFDDAGSQDPDCQLALETCGLGQKGLMPDNWFHQVLASGGYNFPYRTRVTLSTAFGWMLQDDDFLPYTVNPNLTAVDQDGIQIAGTELAALPRTSLDGEIFTTVVDFAISSRPLEKWKFDLGYRFDNRENNTPQDLYVYIRNDSENQVDLEQDPASAEARYNLPYSYTQHRVDFDAGYRLWRRTELSLGYEWKLTDRDYQEVEELTEHTVGLILTSHPYPFLSTRLRYAHAWRDGDDYVGNRPLIARHTVDFFEDQFASCDVGVWPASECPFENHPLLRKSYLANRERDDLKFSLTLLPLENLNASIHLGYVNEDYDDSELGITNTEHWSPGIDVSYTAFDRLTTYAFYTYEYFKIKQKGLAWVGFAQGGVPPIVQTTDPDRLWRNTDEDTTHTVGVGFDLDILPRRLGFGADYLYAKSRGETDMRLGPVLTPGSPYADNIAKQHNVSVHADYRFTEHFSMRIGYLFAKLRWSDWAIDDVTATTITPSSGYGGVIGTGQRSEDYSNNVVSWSLVYTFW